MNNVSKMAVFALGASLAIAPAANAFNWKKAAKVTGITVVSTAALAGLVHLAAKDKSNAFWAAVAAKAVCATTKSKNAFVESAQWVGSLAGKSKKTAEQAVEKVAETTENVAAEAKEAVQSVEKN